MSIKPSDVLFYGAGASLKKYGTLSRHTTVIARRGEDVEETFTRTGAAATWAGDGTLVSAAANLPRVSHWADGAILSTPRLALEDAGTNLCIYSDALSNWADGAGTPTTTDAAISLGDLDLCLVGDDNGAATEYKSQSVTYNSDVAKGVCCYVKEGVTPGAAGTQFRMYDSGNVAVGLDMLIEFTGGVPDVTESTGTLELSTLISDGVYRLDFQTTAVSTAAGVFRLEVYPAVGGAANTGDIYMGGVQTENALFCSSRIVTSGGTATRNAETLSFPFGAPPQSMTMYAKTIERGTITDPSAKVWFIGDATGTDSYIMIQSTGTYYQAYFYDGTNNKTSVVAAAPSIGSGVELLLRLSPAGAVTITQSIDGATATSGTESAVQALPDTWGSELLYLNSNAANNLGFVELEAAIAARGTHSLADFRAILP